jgi:hypothetical protein
MYTREKLFHSPPLSNLFDVLLFRPEKENIEQRMGAMLLPSFSLVRSCPNERDETEVREKN